MLRAYEGLTFTSTQEAVPASFDPAQVLHIRSPSPEHVRQVIFPVAEHVSQRICAVPEHFIHCVLPYMQP